MLQLIKSRKYLNLELNPARGLMTRVIERPGLWMEAGDLKKLVEDIHYVIRTINVGELNYGISSGARDVLNKIVITLIYDVSTGKPIAFNALTIMECSLRGKPIPVVHLGLVVIDPNARARGLSWILYGFTTFLLFLKNRFKPLWISNVTQVPAIIGMVSESIGNVFPNPKLQTRRSYDHLLIAREIMASHRNCFGVGKEADFDEDQFIIKNAYTGGSDNLKKTFEEAPKHRNDIFNQFALKNLDYERGDDILQIGQVDIKSYYHYIIDSVPNESKLIILYKIFFHVFELSLVPILQWLSPTKQMGVLRSRAKTEQK
jgi:hypothetical protein